MSHQDTEPSPCWLQNLKVFFSFVLITEIFLNHLVFSADFHQASTRLSSLFLVADQIPLALLDFPICGFLDIFNI